MPRLRALALLFGVMLVPACGGEDEPEAPSSIDSRHVRGGMGGGRASGDRPPSSAAAGSETRIPSTARPPTEDDPFASMTERLARSEEAGAREEEAAEAANPAPEAASARDLPAELSGLFGSPTTCFDFARVSTLRDLLGDTLNVHVSVTVMPSGRVNRASVSAPGLLPAELACLEQRAAGLSMRGPIEGAPRTVSTDIVYDIETTPTHE